MSNNAPDSHFQPTAEPARRIPPTVENLRRASQAVYLACEEVVADDISDLFKWSADQIATLTARCEALEKALQLQEQADHAHANCDECEGEEVPELCPKCFPLFDDARIARRALLPQPSTPEDR